MVANVSPLPPSGLPGQADHLQQNVGLGGLAVSNAQSIVALTAQMGVVINTLNAMTSQMKSFERTMSNMDVNMRSVRDLRDQTSQARSESLTTPISGNPTSSPVSPGDHHRRLSKGRHGLIDGLKDQTSASLVRDLRIDRIVRAGNTNGTLFRVSASTLVPIFVILDPSMNRTCCMPFFKYCDYIIQLFPPPCSQS